MYQLTHKDGFKILAELKTLADGSMVWFEWGTSWQLKSEGWVWCELIKELD